MANPVRLTWAARGQHILRDRAPLPPSRFMEESAFGAEEAQPFDPGRSNLLIRGENLFALQGLLLLPGFAGKIDLIYVDPPFNTGNESAAYNDTFEQDAWLSMMEERLMLAKSLLRPGGILAVHTDREEQPYLRVLLDEMLSRRNLIAQISWQRAPDRTLLGQGATMVNDCVEYITVYSNGPVREDLPIPKKEGPLSWKTLRSYSRTLQVSSLKTLADEFTDPGGNPVRIFVHGSYSLEPVGAENLRRAASASWDGLKDTFPRMVRLTNQQKESTFQQELIRRMPLQGCLYSAEYVQTKGKYKGPRTRYYLNGQVVLFLKDVARLEGGAGGGGKGSKGGKRSSRIVRVSDMNNFWGDDEIPMTGIAREGGVALRRSKKPERLLHRIITAFSREGDLVLDFFAGSGTTGSVAHKTGRRWIMVDASEDAVSLALDRMKRVVDGRDRSGVTRQAGWKGGGGFRFWSVLR
jgi:adenine-specific DNA-methyltransferase